MRISSLASIARFQMACFTLRISICAWLIPFMASSMPNDDR